MKLWHLFFNREVKSHEAFSPIDESRECGASAAFDARLSHEANCNAAMDEARAVLDSHASAARPTARVFLMPLPISKMRLAVLGLVLFGYRIKHHGSIVEMVRDWE